ncbi:hypothetical protein EJ08DRAFT_266982 [Tothia fuscella]|uniref:F-box domain-containing protein n=1 Tax=Tothia fuscella TaxID=1048955 RepID=A0A9P4NQE6_9PEZI|nr:hypothetical protein EJ08DRAFT_266982 [Tothia fuscella]
MGFSKQETLLHLSYWPRYILNSVISLESESIDPASKRPGNDHPSSLGNLDRLPLELLLEAFTYLDFQSVSRLSRVSMRSYFILASLTAYRDLTSSTRHVFSVLKNAGILGLHSIGTLHDVLFTGKCASCGAFGAFLLLLSAERCCFVCLTINQSLWVFSLPVATQSFGLTKQQLSVLPFMWSIPGKYGLSYTGSRQKSVRLVSVKAVEKLAIKLYGSEEKHNAKCPLIPFDIVPYKLEKWRWYRLATLLPLAQNPLMVNDRAIRPKDDFFGMGVTPFPSLLNGCVEEGLWCRGCELTLEKYDLRSLRPDVLASLVPQGCDVRSFLERMQHKARTRAGFLEHAKHCPLAG